MNITDLIPIIGITSGCLLTGYLFTKIVGLIKYWIDRKNNSSDDIELLLHQFNSYKNSVEKRLQHLEAIAADDPDDPVDSPLLDNEHPDTFIKDKDDDLEERRLQNMLKRTH